MSEATGGGGTGGITAAGCDGSGGGFGSQTPTYGVVMPSPRSWYQPVAYSMMVGTWAALPGTTETWSYMYWGVLATTTPDPIVPGNTRLEPNGEAPCRATIVPGGQNRQGSTGRAKRGGSDRTPTGAATTKRFG